MVFCGLSRYSTSINWFQTYSDDYAYIVSSAFNNALKEGGFEPKAVLSYLRTHQLIKLDTKNKSQVTKRIGGSVVRCIALKLQNQEDL